MISLTEDLKKNRQVLEEAFGASASGHELNRLTTDQYDRLITGLFNEESGGQRISLVALGGYGRGEMAPYSDIDFLLLHDGEDNAQLKGLIDGIMYPLWDAGVETAGVVRTVDECLKVGRSDIRSLSAMMESRIITGDRALFSELSSAIGRYISGKRNRHRYLRRKLGEHAMRLKKYGDTVFVAEPHVKEGEGGLRCYHSSLWVCRVQHGTGSLKELVSLGIIDQKGADEWMDALDFLWRVRFGLHLIAKRRQDRLDFDLQKRLAERMGYSEGESRPGLEEFMHHFYKSASFIHNASERLIGASLKHGGLQRIRDFFASLKLEKHISVRGGSIHISPDRIASCPELVFRAWLTARRMKLRMGNESKEVVRSAVSLWGDSVEKDAGIHEIFRELVKSPVGLNGVLLEMHETGALFRLIPELERLYHRVEYDAYHLYTVDIHTIFLIREIASLAAGEYKDSCRDFHAAYRGIARPDLLIMASLLHDIGKGKRGRERHDHLGARIARDVMTRLGYRREEVDLVDFLVGSHLILPQIAFCRDTDDPQLIENLAYSVKTTENLLMLYILAFADIRATNPELWSSWKGELLTSLYRHTTATLTGEGFTSRQAALIRHFREIKELDKDPVRLEVLPSEGQAYDNLAVITKDASGLFSRICAVFCSNAISILEAQLYTGQDGGVVDLFKVVSAGGKKMPKGFDWKRVKDELQTSITAPVSTPSDQQPATMLRQSRLGYRTNVVVDNDVSTYYTVVEIHAPDRVGLLYMVAHWFYVHGYDIFMARATTHVGQAIDVFYIKRIDGKKAESKDEIAGIKKGLTDVISVDHIGRRTDGLRHREPHKGPQGPEAKDSRINR